jgi:hypothetical protein
MKTYQKGFIIPLIISIIAILIIGGVVFVTQNKKVEAPVVNNSIATTTPVIGGDKDEHGCLGPAGYSWCAVKNKCLRVWEEKCETIPVSTSTTPTKVCQKDNDCAGIACKDIDELIQSRCIRGVCTQTKSCFDYVTNPVACTMDAKMCSDGSYVGRSGPNCEFVCPK